MKDFSAKLDRIAPNWALLIIRLAVGFTMAAHGSMKLFGWFGGHGIAGTVAMVHMLGFPAPALFAWVVIFAEFFAGLALIVGLLTRLAAFGIACDMLVAILKVHGPNGFFLPKGFEYPFVLMSVAISLILTGAGMYSLDWVARRLIEKRYGGRE